MDTCGVSLKKSLNCLPLPRHHAACFSPPSGRDDGGDRLPRRMQAYGCARAMGFLAALFSHGLGSWLLPTIIYWNMQTFFLGIIRSLHSGNYTPGDVSPIAVANLNPQGMLVCNSKFGLALKRTCCLSTG